MRRTLLLAAAFVLPLCFVLSAAGQTAGAAPQDTPETLRAAYDQAVKAKDWPAAIAAAQQLVDGHATSFNLKLLGNAQLYGGAAEEALATYEHALAAAEQEKPTQGQPDQAWKDDVGHLYIAKGNALLMLKRTAEAVDAYNQAAAVASNPSLAYFNVCATFYNNGDTKNAADACRKSAQADPTRANAWYVLASALFADADYAKGKVTITAECRDALNKYLELAPDGPHAADVKAMLDMATKQ